MQKSVFLFKFPKRVCQAKRFIFHFRITLDFVIGNDLGGLFIFSNPQSFVKGAQDGRTCLLFI